MVKSKSTNFPISFSEISLPLHLSLSSRSSIQNFPAELLLMTFQDFDIPTLLNVCNVCKRFQQIGTKVLSKKFQEPNIGLMFTFEQEHKYRFNVPFEFTKFNEQNGNFIFKPKSKQPMRFIHSSMVRNPVLSKVSVTGINYSSNNNETLSPNPTNTSSNSSTKIKKLEENFLQPSLALGIKSQEEILKKVRYVYRIGHGTTHLRIPYLFTYSVADDPPPFMQKTRGGERWLTPISFECAPSFFYPREPTAHKIIMTIVHLRKKNLHKKKPSPPPQKSNYKQKQKVVQEEVEDYISIELESDQGSLNNINRKRLLEQQMNQCEHLLSRRLKGTLAAKRWISGARR